MMNFWRSQDLYSDHMVRQFAFNGLPLSRIDNCSFMIGTTGTCYKRGIAAWKGSLILSLARGGWLNVYHGNLELLNDADAAWFGRVQQTYMQLQQFGQTSCIGSVPGFGQWYGYRSETMDGVLFTIVNPSQSFQTIALGEGRFNAGRILFQDIGYRAVFKENELTIGPEQLVVIGLGRYDSDAYQWGTENDIIIPEKIEPVMVEIHNPDLHTAILRVLPTEKMNIRILFSQCDENGIPFRSWGGAPPNGMKMNEFFSITAKQGKKNIPVRIEYDKMIWCGLSWAAGEIQATDINPKQPVEITCTSKEGESKYFRINVYNVEIKN
jgi:hypothetical protein